MPSILTLEEAAEYLKLKPEELSQELVLHRLPGVNIAGQWRLKKEVLDRLFEKPKDNNGTDCSISPRVRGRIFAYNSGKRFGHIRLADGRVVWIRAQHFADQNYIPQVGDIVEFNMKLTLKGFQAVSVIFISHNGHVTGESVPLRDVQFHAPVQMLAQNMEMYDIYSRTLPVSGNSFFGREKLLIQLTDEIHSGQFLGICGLRKMGKTSLLYQLRDEKLREEAVAYIDLQSSNSLSSGNCNPLYWELERDLYLRLREREQEVSNMLRLGKFERFSDLPEEKVQQCRLIFSEDIRSILDALAAGKISSVKRIVIVLDELERILPIGGQPGIEGYLNFFGLLRGLAQTERYQGLLSSIVVAANASISERGYWEGIENPVFALYKPLFLPCFTLEECNEMIVTLGKNMSVYWADDALKTIFAETGGHPFLTRIFCSRIVKQYPARPITVTVEMVKEQLIPFIRTESDKLQQITELLHTHFPKEEKFLNQIALDEAPKNLPDEALRHLLGYNLIQSGGKNCYHITINLLRRWLRRRAGERY